MRKRLFALFLAVLMLCTLAACKVESNPDYPTKPIQLYVGAAPGGGTDVLARLIVPEMEKQLGQSIAIVNKAGAAGTLSNLEVALSAKDGYTIGMLTDFETIGNLLSGQNLGYTKDDLTIIGSVNASTNILILGKNFSGEKTIKGFVEYCKANSGKVTISTAAAAQRMVLQSFSDVADIKFTPIPFESGSSSFNALLGGQVDACFTSPTFNKQAVDNGCTTIAVASHERYSILANVPTLKESGYNTINNEVTRLLFAPSGTPDYIIEALETAFKNATATQEFNDALVKINEMYTYKSAKQAVESFNEKYDAIKKIVDENPGILS